MTEGLSCYRAYLLGAGGGIADVAVIEAANDSEAVAMLRTMHNAYGIELWDRDRRIITTEPAAPVEAATPRESLRSPFEMAAAGR